MVTCLPAYVPTSLPAILPAYVPSLRNMVWVVGYRYEEGVDEDDLGMTTFISFIGRSEGGTRSIDLYGLPWKENYSAKPGA